MHAHTYAQIKSVPWSQQFGKHCMTYQPFGNPHCYTYEAMRDPLNKKIPKKRKQKKANL